MNVNSSISAELHLVPLDLCFFRHRIRPNKVSEIMRYAAEHRMWHFPPVIVVQSTIPVKFPVTEASARQFWRKIIPLHKPAAGADRKIIVYRVLDGHHRVTAAKQIRKAIGYPKYILAWVVREDTYTSLISEWFDGKEPFKIRAVRDHIKPSGSDVNANEAADRWDEKARKVRPRLISASRRITRIEETNENEIEVSMEVSCNGELEISARVNGVEVGFSNDGSSYGLYCGDYGLQFSPNSMSQNQGPHIGLSWGDIGLQLSPDSMSVEAALIDDTTGLGVGVEISLQDVEGIERQAVIIDRFGMPQPRVDHSYTTGYSSGYSSGNGSGSS